MSAIYYCNFSLFQSAPDIWAIDQLFPIMPIHRLDEEPEVTATLADLTCDSDGMIDHFIDVEDVRRTIDVHTLSPEEPYYMGMFLNGAYQEILGDLHNLFGDTNAVHVRLNDGGYQIRHVIKGDSVSEVLRYVQYVPENMIEAVRHQAERAVIARQADQRADAHADAALRTGAALLHLPHRRRLIGQASTSWASREITRRPKDRRRSPRISRRPFFWGSSVAVAGGRRAPQKPSALLPSCEPLDRSATFLTRVTSPSGALRGRDRCGCTGGSACPCRCRSTSRRSPPASLRCASARSSS